MKTEVIGIGIGAVVIVAVVIWGIMSLDKKEAVVDGNTNIEQQVTDNTMQEQGDLQIETLEEGKGEASAQKGDMITVNYRGTLTNGQQFDSSYDSGKPFSFQLGAGQVIAGWDKGLDGMKVGEKRRLTIPSNMAYGAQEIPGRIPANSTLIFEVEMLKIGE